MSRKRALVAGALGIVGGNIADYLDGLDDWEVVGIARSRPKRSLPYRLINADLMDEAGCRAVLSREPGFTHLFYAARAPHPDPAAETQGNLRMLVNVVRIGPT